MKPTTTLTCPTDSRYTLVLDPNECFPSDPGNGTPAMVYGPQDSSATYTCATSTGEIGSADSYHDIPAAVLRWLESEECEAAVDAVWDA